MTEAAVNPAGPEPLHHQMRGYIIHKIDSGQWLPNHQIDGELVLAATHQVSRSTVRQAILSLVQDGYLYRRQGKGTYVAEPKIDLNILELRFAAVEDSTHELLDTGTEYASARQAHELDIEPGSALTVIRRLRFVHGERVAIEVSHLEASRFPGIEDVLGLNAPLIDILSNRYHTDITNYQASLEPVLLNQNEQEALEYSSPQALGLLVYRLGLNSEGTPVVHSKSTFRGDRCRAIFNHK